MLPVSPHAPVVLVVATVMASIIALALGLLLNRLIVRNRWTSDLNDVPVTWLQQFSASRYLPLRRLLSRDDVEFLRKQPGFDRRIEKQLRADRKKIFRTYVSMMRRDFNRLYHTLRLLLLSSAQDNPEFANALMRARAIFMFSLLLVDLRLRFGLALPQADQISPLVDGLEQMHTQVMQLLPENGAGFEA